MSTVSQIEHGPARLTYARASRESEYPTSARWQAVNSRCASIVYQGVDPHAGAITKYYTVDHHILQGSGNR
ncbi:MAG: hypothetical protein CPSOU_2284 [uncultured Paraburkholderia sp.]|nr:MAG: hypothetical protein CPSOU_2284 [uncultured Paraburkholderia sp.]